MLKLKTETPLTLDFIHYFIHLNLLILFIKFLIRQGLNKISYNARHNILELRNILVQIRFTTSKTKVDVQYSKLGIQVTSRVAERLKTQGLRKLGNIRKISDLGGHIVQCLVFLQELRFCQQKLKNTQKQIPNVSFSIQFYWITPFCSKYFVRNCKL